MKVTYLEHSGFALEMEEKVLVFDYYRGELPEFDRQKKIYVFASHAHRDHFVKAIFKWAETYEHITYILSDDIHNKGPEGKVEYVGERQEVTVDDIQIKTLRSTDEGVAFFVHTGGQTIYHAGDLNWWHWKEEGRAYNEMMKRNYQHEIQKIEGESVDVAFVPLDPRQEEQYYWGMDYYMRHTDTRTVFPMHMWGSYKVIDQLMKQKEAAAYKDRVVHITGSGQTFEV